MQQILVIILIVADHLVHVIIQLVLFMEEVIPHQDQYNALEFVTIATTGNGQDFGDLLSARSTDWHLASSDSHGGIE